MGRYIGTGSSQANACSTFSAVSCYQVSTHKYTYNQNECWQNRIIIDTPGSYSFTVPTGISCLRTIAIGGGGKPKCTNSGTCQGAAGSGGGYAERWDTVAAGCAVTIVVGRQEQDTTISYTNSSAVARTITGGGAAGCVAGVGAGGDWISTGGNGGLNFSYCGGSLSTTCGSCICFYAAVCCGYCVVWAGTSARQIDPGSENCCAAKGAGGGSAGSWIWSKGGDGQNAYSNSTCLGNGYGTITGGGGGIGYITRCTNWGSSCTCMCFGQFGYNAGCGGGHWRQAAYPSGNGGGGGTKFQCTTFYDWSGSSGPCNSNVWKMGEGGWGGKNNDEGRAEIFMNTYSPGPNNHKFDWSVYLLPGPQPCCYPWHDIHSMQGSGSSGKGMHTDNTLTSGNCGLLSTGATIAGGSTSNNNGFMNSGEGAGTGGYGSYCCELTSMGWSCCRAGADACGTVNWALLCCLGTSGRVCCADKMQDTLFPYIIGCAGTLGGSGGVTSCHLAIKAGKGGGAGVFRSYILCVCWGGAYDCCFSGTQSTTPLAFPPCALDWRVSTAGTGMALIYWKDA